MKTAQNWLSNQGYEINSLKHPQDVSKSISKINLFEIMQQYAEQFHQEKLKNMSVDLIDLHQYGMLRGQKIAKTILKDISKDYSRSELLKMSKDDVDEWLKKQTK